MLAAWLRQVPAALRHLSVVAVSQAAALAVLFVAFVYFAPEHAAALLRASPAAMDYVAGGAESAVLWAALMALRWGKDESVGCAWAGCEAAMRPTCRLALPLDHAPLL